MWSRPPELQSPCPLGVRRRRPIATKHFLTRIPYCSRRPRRRQTGLIGPPSCSSPSSAHAEAPDSELSTEGTEPPRSDSARERVPCCRPKKTPSCCLWERSAQAICKPNPTRLPCYVLMSVNNTQPNCYSILYFICNLLLYLRVSS